VFADVVLQSKQPVEDTVSAEAWQPSADDDDIDETTSEPLTVTLPTTEPGSTSLSFVSHLGHSLCFTLQEQRLLLVTGLVDLLAWCTEYKGGQYL